MKAKAERFLALSNKKQWKKKWELIVLAIDMLDSHYWELKDKKEKQKISRTIDALREQKMVCEYAMMSEKKKKELSEISLLFGEKVQSSIEND